MATSAWAWDWTAVAAVATAALALFTVWLAVSTRSLARATRQDIRSAFRPVVIGSTRDGTGNSVLIVERTPGHRPDSATVKLYLRNAGTGPALNIRLNAKSHGSASGSQTDEILLGTLGHAERDQLSCELPDFNVPRDFNENFGYRFSVTYEDLAAAHYSTHLAYDKTSAVDAGEIETFGLKVSDTKIA
jgi:hypothetical protein